MTEDERRRYPRIETSNTVSYVCVDEDGNEVAEGFGTAVDLSLGGIKLSTGERLESPYILLLVIDLDETLVEVRGRVVYSSNMTDGDCVSGIEFVDTEEKHHRALRNFVKTYHRGKRSVGSG